MKHPRISVITPSFNQAEYLEETMASVLGQRYPELEYIVIDGGSTDGSKSIIEQYSDELAYWVSEPDAGQVDALNKGFAHSTGDILCWLCSDDLLFPRALFRVSQALQTGKPDFIYGAAIQIPQRGGWSYQRWPSKLLPNPGANATSSDQLITCYNFLDQSSAFWTRELWELTGPLNPRFQCAFDWEWWIRAAKHCNIRPFEHYLSMWRRYDEQKTRKYQDIKRAEVLEIIREHAPQKWQQIFQFAKDHEPSELDIAYWMLGFREPTNVGHRKRPLSRESKNVRMARALGDLAHEGIRRVAIFGAGQHTRQTLRTLQSAPVEICAVLDDHLSGTIGNFPILPPDAVSGLAVDAVVLSSDAFEDQMWNNRKRFESIGIRVVRLYG